MKNWIPAIVAAGVLSSLAQAENAPPGANKLSPVIIEGKPPIQEERVVGDHQQPQWTTSGRISPLTRAYVLPPWKIEFAQWWKGEWPKGEGSEHFFQEELEIGLPCRFQLDLYENWERNSAGAVRHSGNQVEVRYALADWGKIPLNPTLYAEWKFNDDAADAYELKLLLTEELAPRWHWGFNGSFEQEVGGLRSTELAVSQSITYTFIDDKLSGGLEMVLEHKSEKGDRHNPSIEFLAGPSIMWQICPRSRFSIVGLWGASHDAPHAEIIANFSISLWPGQEKENGHAPMSIRSK